MRAPAALAGLALLAWSSKLHETVVGGARRGRLSHEHSRLLRHAEAPAGRSWLWGSGVCALGKLAWVFWACAVVTLSSRLRVPAALWLACLSITALCALAWNAPLFVRSMPAYVVLAWAFGGAGAVTA